MIQSDIQYVKKATLQIESVMNQSDIQYVESLTGCILEGFALVYASV